MQVQQRSDQGPISSVSQISACTPIEAANMEMMDSSDDDDDEIILADLPDKVDEVQIEIIEGTRITPLIEMVDADTPTDTDQIGQTADTPSFNNAHQQPTENLIEADKNKTVEKVAEKSPRSARSKGGSNCSWKSAQAVQ